MSQKSRTVARLKLNADRPTRLTFDDLYTWVIWQFPRRTRDGHYGAVRPPLAGHSWLPALVSPERGRVTVYGQLEESFASPGAAAAWLENLRKRSD